MKSYTLGFLFTTDKNNVWLIRKNKPEWQKGLYNGIGGKLELNELPLNAMIREFREETGLEIKDWKWYCSLTDEETYEVYCYYSFSDLIPKTITDEVVNQWSIKDLPNNIIPNLNWLIPMSLSFNNGERAERFVITEII